MFLRLFKKTFLPMSCSLLFSHHFFQKFIKKEGYTNILHLKNLTFTNTPFVLKHITIFRNLLWFITSLTLHFTILSEQHNITQWVLDALMEAGSRPKE